MLDNIFNIAQDMRLDRSRKEYLEQFGQPVEDNVCFICGDEIKKGWNLCKECTEEFPIKREKCD